jgi:hypothetical protein
MVFMSWFQSIAEASTIGKDGKSGASVSPSFLPVSAFQLALPVAGEVQCRHGRSTG